MHDMDTDTWIASWLLDRATLHFEEAQRSRAAGHDLDALIEGSAAMAVLACARHVINGTYRDVPDD